MRPASPLPKSFEEGAIICMFLFSSGTTNFVISLTLRDDCCGMFLSHSVIAFGKDIFVDTASGSEISGLVGLGS